jgi:adenylate kinase
MDRIRKGSVLEDGTIIVGHLAHELDVDVAIVLRARPEIIEQRLRARGYSEGKAVENAEAEAIDVITIESVDSVSRVYEIDASELSVSEAADLVEEIIVGRGERFTAGRIDFSSYILGGY